MIRTEEVIIDENIYTKTWSDANKMIERDGVLYESAVDPAYLGRTYTEIDRDIPDTEADESDYLAALDRLGVSSDV